MLETISNPHWFVPSQLWVRQPLKLWADALRASRQPVFLQEDHSKKISKPRSALQCPAQAMDGLNCRLFLLLIHSIILATALYYLYGADLAWNVVHWHRTQFLPATQFSATTVANRDSRATLLIRWIIKYNADKNLQLFQVLWWCWEFILNLLWLRAVKGSAQKVNKR